MRALFYLMAATLKNLIKSAFKKPIVLIGYILAFLFFAVMIAGAFLMPGGFVREAPHSLFRGIMLMVFLALYYTTLKLGIEKGSTYFRMADVNLIFQAPIKSNRVLLYGFIKQIGGTFLLLFFAMFQIPNLKNNFVMEPYGVWMLLSAVAAYALSYPLMGMVIYSWATKNKSRKKILKRILDGCALIIAVLFLAALAQTKNIIRAIDVVFNNPVAHYFPVIGWTASIASTAVTGLTTEFWVGVIGMLVLIIGSSVILYRMNPDYYEDVLEGTEYLEAAVKAKREGNNLMFNAKVKSKVKQKLAGSGAKAIFYKHLLEIRKTAYFLFFDRTSIIVMVSAIVFRFLLPSETGVMALFMVLCFSVYMLLLFQMQGKLGGEMERHFIFLIPASSAEKLFYTTLSEHIKNLFDGCVLFVTAGIIFGANFPVIAACILTYVMFGAVFVYTDVLSRKLFGWVHSKGLLMFIKIAAAILIQIPGIAAVVFVLIATESELFMTLALGGWSFILAVTLFVFSAGILKHLESAG